MSTKPSISDLKKRAIEIRDKAQAEIKAKNDLIVKTALTNIIKSIEHRSGSLVYDRDDKGLPMPEITMAFSSLVPDKESTLSLSHIELIRKELAPDFTVEYIRAHCFQCDCEQDEGCTDFLKVTWSWD